MRDEYDIYLQAIRTYVCSICQHATPQNICGVTASDGCAVERFLPQIVDVATRVESDRIDDYVSALRETVCSLCRTDNGLQCERRDAADCALDRYFVLIIEAIERVILQQKKDQGAGARVS